MTTFLSETFTDTDGTLLSAHTPDVGGTWEALDFTLISATASSQAVEISGNKARSTANGTNGRAYRNTATPASSEYDVSADFVLGNVATSGTTWVVAGRCSATGTTGAAVDRYSFYYSGNSTAGSRQWVLRKIVAGTVTTLSSLAENTSGTVSVTLEIRDATKSGVAGGVVKVSSSDNAITQVGVVAVGLPSNLSNTNFIDNLTAATVSAGGTVTGTASSTLPAFTQAASGTFSLLTLTFTGTAASVLPAFTQSAAGTRTVPVFTGTAASTLPSFSQAAAGTHTAPVFTASAASTLPAFSQAATGTVTAPTYTGTAASVLPAFTQAAAGTVTVPVVTGTAVSTLPAFTQAAAGSVDNPGVDGTATSVLPAFTQSAAGSFSIPNRTGTAASTLPSFTQAATGAHTAPGVTGEAASLLPAFSQSAAGLFTMPTSTGIAVSVLPAFTQQATGAHTVPVFTATAASVLAAFTQAAVAWAFGLGPTPASRTLTIAAESRIQRVPAENRTVRVPAERRALEVV